MFEGLSQEESYREGGEITYRRWSHLQIQSPYQMMNFMKIEEDFREIAAPGSTLTIYNPTLTIIYNDVEIALLTNLKVRAFYIEKHLGTYNSWKSLYLSISDISWN